MQKQLYSVINDMWQFLKTYTSGTPSEERRVEAFREINALMVKHGIKRGSPLGDFTYEILRSSFDLIDDLYREAASFDDRQAGNDLTVNCPSSAPSR